MNKFEMAVDRIKKNVEIQDSWTEEDLEHYKQYLRGCKKNPKKPKEPKPLSEIAKENGIPLGCLMQRLEKMSLKEALKKPLARG